ncbi:tRNA pseudouridine(13) synthase TruD [Patescibacteria group bacterium]|nr:tRNA pseudouridine(13) synthase TruD [Patescibacteria group bacterium]
MNIVEMQERERQTTDAVRSKDPTRVERVETPDPDMILGRIGVTYLSPERANGYIRLYPQDFLVEEITKKGEIVSLINNTPFQDSDDRRTLWVDLLKIHLSGPNALQEIQRELNITDKQVAAAGIKDAVAITAQRLSLRGITKEQAEAVKYEKLFLRPISYGSGALQIGDLQGNRFTIVIRGQVQESRKMLDAALAHIRDNGFLNFFGPQRFGSRLNSHQLGKKLIQGDVDGALQMYFGEPGPFDVPLYREMRLALGESYGDWDRMLKYAEHFPFTLKDEAKVIQSLKQDSRKTRMALMQIKDQVRLWVYAYGSWLVNRVISRAVANGDTLPAEIPMPFSPSGPSDLYRDFMEQDGTLDYVKALADYSYINVQDRTIPAIMRPKGLEAREIDQGWVVRFELGKGAYATSLLSHLVRMHEGMPLPDWVPDGEVDALEVMGDGKIEDLRSRFGSFMKRRDEIDV